MSTDPVPPQYVRVNVLIACALMVVIICMFVVVQLHVTDEFAKGILTLVLGRFLGYVDNIYNFEFGTTRSSGKKDETIVALTKTAGDTAVASAAATTAAVAAATGAQPPPVLPVAPTATPAVQPTEEGKP